MFISRIQMQNWKNFKEADLSLQRRLFIVGANASGKSNLLDAIRFIRDVAIKGLQQAVQDRGGVSKIRCLAAREKPSIKLEFFVTDFSGPGDVEGGAAQDEWRYLLEFKHTGGGIQKSEARIVREAVYHNGLNVLERGPELAGEDEETLKFTFLQQPNANRNFKPLFRFFSDVQYLHVVPQLMRDSDSYFLAQGREDFFGRNFLDRISRANKATRNSYLKRIQDSLALAVPQFTGLEFIKDDKGVPHLQARFKHWRASDAIQNESQLSDGTLRLIGFIWALLDGGETLLLEEPELYLHAAVVRQIPGIIYRNQHRRDRVRQVIVTTHSYELLSDPGIAAEEIVVLFPGKEGTEARIASDVSDAQTLLQAGMSPAEAVLPMVAPPEIEKLAQLSAE